jgi:hypothetical protein
MAALTATLIGLALAGGLTAGKTIADKQNAASSGPGPGAETKPTTAIVGPPQTNASDQNAQAAGAQAATRQKKRAAAADTILTGGTKTGTGIPRDFPSAGTAAPASLIGS